MDLMAGPLLQGDVQTNIAWHISVLPKKGQVPPDARGWLSGKAGKYIMVGYIIYERLRHF